MVYGDVIYAKWWEELHDHPEATPNTGCCYSGSAKTIMEEQSLLDSLPQEQRQQLARRLRQEQIRRYYARDKASPVSQPERRAGKKRVSFLPREKILDAMKRDDQEESMSTDGLFICNQVLTFRSCSKHAYKLRHATNYLVLHMHHINFTVRKILQAQLASPDTTSEATGASLLHQVMHVTGYARIRIYVHCGPLLAVWEQTHCTVVEHYYILNMLLIIRLKYTFKSF